MILNRGDVVLVLYPNSDLRTAKRRPALVVQADSLETGLNQVVVAMISSNLTRAGHPGRISVTHVSSDARRMGLRTDSVIACDNLATVLLSEIARVIGDCSIMPAVDIPLKHTLGL